jgi:hypothetical protein
VAAVKRSEGYGQEGGADDEPYAEELHDPATPAAPRLTAGMTG